MKNQFAIIACLFSYAVLGQGSMDIDWQRNLGGGAGDFFTNVGSTADGGYILTGYTSSDDIEVPSYNGSADTWVVKTDPSGTTQWQQCFGGSAMDNAQAIIQTGDGGYMLVGSTSSNDGHVTGHHGGYDALVIRLDANGELIWAKCFGGTLNDHGMDLIRTSDDRFMMVGSTNSNDEDVHGNNGNYDVWVLSFDSDGVIEWQNCYGGSANDLAEAICTSPSGGYAIACSTTSTDGDVTGNNGNNDVWILNIDTNGSIVWQYCYGGSYNDTGNDIFHSPDEGLIFAATCVSSDGHISTNHGGSDGWIGKLDSNGTLLWEKSYGGSDHDELFNIQTGAQGNIVVSGYTISMEIEGHSGAKDLWVMELTENGDLIWEKAYGGSNTEEATGSIMTVDGGIFLAGYSNSIDGDLGGNNGSHDAWMLKLAPNHTSVHGFDTNPTSIIPNPTHGPCTILFSTTDPGIIRIVLHDLAGHMLVDLFTGHMPVGGTTLNFSIDQVPAGIYFLQIQSGKQFTTHKVVKL